MICHDFVWIDQYPSPLLVAFRDPGALQEQIRPHLPGLGLRIDPSHSPTWSQTLLRSVTSDFSSTSGKLYGTSFSNNTLSMASRSKQLRRCGS